MATVDISSLAKSDQAALREAVKTGDYSAVSEAALRVVTDTPYSTGEVISRQVERSVTSTIRGIADLFGLEPESDRQAEIESRAMFELNPGASWSSYIGGSILDPVNAVPGGAYKTATQAFVKLGAFGGALGFVEPTYDDFEDSRLRNAAVGAGTLGLFGAGVTGFVNKIAGKSAQEVEQALTDQASDSLSAATTTAGPKPRLRSGPAVARDPLTPEAMFGQETSAIPDIDVKVYRPDAPIELTLPNGTPFRGTQEQAVNNGHLNVTGLGNEAPFTPPKFERTHGSPKPGFQNKGAVNFESDLDKAFYIIAKEEGKRSPADAKFLDFVMRSTGLSEAAARAEGKRIVSVVKKELKDVKSASEKVIPTTWKPTPTKATRPTQPSIEQTAQNAKQLSEAPKLNGNLFEEPIIHNGSPLIFNSDIDKAAVAVSKNSPNKQEYFNFIKNTFGINNQQTQKIIDDVTAEVLKKLNKSKTVAGSQAGKKAGKKAGKTPVQLSDTVDNIVNPVFKHMDDESRYIYNYSNFITGPDGKAHFKLDGGFNQFMNQMRQIFPDIKVNEAVATAQGYQRLMDNLKLEKGAKFTSTNIRDFAKNRNGNLDAFIASIKRGDLDGCWS